MDEYQNQLNWGYICQTQKLSENFIRNHENKMVWNFVSKYQTLTEKFINDYQNELNWDNVSKYQNLSERSEEHTSELQSRQYLVCRLLLEKKKTTYSPSPHDIRS